MDTSVAHSLLLDTSRTSGVFELLFAVSKDETSMQSEARSLREDSRALREDSRALREDSRALREDRRAFNEDLRDIFGPIRISETVVEQLRQIHRRVYSKQVDILQLAQEVAQEFSDQKEVLVYVLSVLLRITVEDGMMYRKDRERIGTVFRAFSLAPAELDLLSDEAKENLDCFFLSTKVNGDNATPAEIRSHLKILGCTEQSSDGEIRSAYRRLARKFHPDAASASQKSANELARIIHEPVSSGLRV